MFSPTPCDKKWLLFGGAIAFAVGTTTTIAFLYRFIYQHGHFLGLYFDYYNSSYFPRNFISIIYIDGLTPLILSVFFLWIKRFSTRFQNCLFAVFIISFSTASLSISFFASLQAIIYFIFINNLVFLPIVCRLSLAPDTETIWLTTSETNAQNKRYWLLFFATSLFCGVIGGFCLLMSGVMSVSSLLNSVMKLLFFLLIFMLFALFFGTIPALATMWAVVLLRLQRNLSGITLCIFIGLSFATLFGAVLVYTQSPYDLFFVPINLSIYTCAGGFVGAIIAYYLPKPTSAQAKYGISALDKRKKLAGIIIGVTVVYILLAIPISYYDDPSDFYNDMNKFSPRGFFAILNQHFCIGLLIASLIALFFSLIYKNPLLYSRLKQK